MRRGRIAICGLLLATMSLAACGGGEAAQGSDASAPNAAASDAVGDTGGQPAYGLVTPTVAAELASDSAVTVIDVRTSEEFAEGHLGGAALIDFNSPSFEHDVARLDRDRSYLVYCRSGNRSGQAVAVMGDLGFERVWDMDGGVTAWVAEGRELVT
jgi:rhodanese-related sulfurtransferase